MEGGVFVGKRTRSFLFFLGQGTKYNLCRCACCPFPKKKRKERKGSRNCSCLKMCTQPRYIATYESGFLSHELSRGLCVFLLFSSLKYYCYYNFPNSAATIFCFLSSSVFNLAVFFYSLFAHPPSPLWMHEHRTSG